MKNPVTIRQVTAMILYLCYTLIKYFEFTMRMPELKKISDLKEYDIQYQLTRI